MQAEKGQVRYVTTARLRINRVANLEPLIQIESSPAVGGVLAMVRCVSTRNERSLACGLAMAKN
jgi:hypothetical protein